MIGLTHSSTWVFGYGSLIYKVDFPYLCREAASICGWERRFWQGSHDHRGTPTAPGRVATLVAAPDAVCGGMAYLVNEQVFEHLDHREKNGYRRVQVSMRLSARQQVVEAVVYLAAEDNPAYLGPAPLADVAQHIARSSGPSGSNRDYVLQLAHALRRLGHVDDHVLALESLLL